MLDWPEADTSRVPKSLDTDDPAASEPLDGDAPAERPDANTSPALESLGGNMPGPPGWLAGATFSAPEPSEDATCAVLEWPGAGVAVAWPEADDPPAS